MIKQKADYPVVTCRHCHNIDEIEMWKSLSRKVTNLQYVRYYCFDTLCSCIVAVSAVAAV